MLPDPVHVWKLSAHGRYVRVDVFVFTLRQDSLLTKKHNQKNPILNSEFKTYDMWARVTTPRVEVTS